jgi:putative two-component system response regulator
LTIPKKNIDILVEALGDDYEISVAIDGESAIECVKNEPPDIILLDIMMPKMTDMTSATS